ncbi:hypothetical protein A2U01_0092830, partial [Trifolium medium]|nr:hypothetical protein [Trifolium medium]
VSCSLMRCNAAVAPITLRTLQCCDAVFIMWWPNAVANVRHNCNIAAASHGAIHNLKRPPVILRLPNNM